MADMVYCEFLKFKRSKVQLIAFLGTLVTPLLAIINSIRNHFMHPKNAITLFGIYDSAFMFLMLLFGPLLFSIIASYLFSREYTEKTLKTLFVVPISKKKFLSSKFIALFLCILLLMLISWTEIFILGGICNLVLEIEQFNFSTALFFLIKMLLGAILLYLTITPLAFLSMYTKGFIIPMITASIIALGNVILTSSPIAGFFPWTAAYLIINNRINQSTCPTFISFLIILLISILSYICSILLFVKNDID